MIDKQLAPCLGGLIWSAVSVALTIAGIRAVPDGRWTIAVLIYALGMLPGLLALRRLVAFNATVLAQSPSRVPLLRLFVPRFWLMMLVMAGTGQALRIIPVHRWLYAGFCLFSASTLLCGAVTFLAHALRRQE